MAFGCIAEASLDLAKSGQGLFEEVLSCLGQTDAAGGSRQKRHAETLLKGAHTLADARLRATELSRGAGKTSGLGDDLEDEEIGNVATEHSATQVIEPIRFITLPDEAWRGQLDHVRNSIRRCPMIALKPLTVALALGLALPHGAAAADNIVLVHGMNM